MLALHTYIPTRYINHLLSLCRLPHFRGLLGGRPNSSFYFVGYCDETLLYLDPHFTQPYVDLSTPSSDSLASYRTCRIFRLPLSQLDPCVGISFLCTTLTELHTLQRRLYEIANQIPEENRIFDLISSTQHSTTENTSITQFDFDDI
jgi:cysteine protease ATG4